MGYANPAQTSKGIHLRQYSRAFIIADAANKSRIVFVSTDSCMQSQGLKLEVHVINALIIKLIIIQWGVFDACKLEHYSEFKHKHYM